MQASTRQRTFRVGKLVREGVLEDIIRRGGRLWLGNPRHAALHQSLAAKFYEEWFEASAASAAFTTRNAGLLEELGDVWETLHLTREVLVTPSTPGVVLEEGSSGYPGLNFMAGLWHQLVVDLKPLDPHDENLSGKAEIIRCMEITALAMRQHLPAHGLTFKQVEAAGRAKRLRKGRLVVTRLEGASLPADDEWVETFAKKFDEVEPTLFNPHTAVRGWPGNREND